MANKRMFDKKVVGSDKFIDLPNSSKALYFMAGMEADDKGFFQPRKLQRMCGFSDDDYKILIAKGFFITFDSGVMVVTDWNKNNWLDSRRVTETEYIDELNLLKLVNQKYEFKLENGDAKQMLSEYSIVENSIEYKERNIKERKFRKPTLQEVQEYCEERNNNVDPEQFINFYESKNWMIGKNKMKDWKACIRTWEKRATKSVVVETIPEWFNKEQDIQIMTKQDEEQIESILKEIGE